MLGPRGLAGHGRLVGKGVMLDGRIGPFRTKSRSADRNEAGALASLEKQ